MVYFYFSFQKHLRQSWCLKQTISKIVDSVIFHGCITLFSDVSIKKKCFGLFSKIKYETIYGSSDFRFTRKAILELLHVHSSKDLCESYRSYVLWFSCRLWQIWAEFPSFWHFRMTQKTFQQCHKQCSDSFASQQWKVKGFSRISNIFHSNQIIWDAVHVHSVSSFTIWIFFYFTCIYMFVSYFSFTVSQKSIKSTVLEFVSTKDYSFRILSYVSFSYQLWDVSLKKKNTEHYWYIVTTTSYTINVELWFEQIEALLRCIKYYWIIFSS